MFTREIVKAADLLRRYPFTAAGLAVIVTLGAVFRTFVTQVAEHPWADRISYGVPAFRDDRWWAVFTGAPFAITPLCYVAVLASFAAFVGLAEHRLGTARTMAVWALGHVAGVFGAIGLVDLTGSALVSAVDVGPSGGAMAAAAVCTATFSPRWRSRCRSGPWCSAARPARPTSNPPSGSSPRMAAARCRG